jgi:hypothetical protein
LLRCSKPAVGQFRTDTAQHTTEPFAGRRALACFTASGIGRVQCHRGAGAITPGEAVQELQHGAVKCAENLFLNPGGLIITEEDRAAVECAFDKVVAATHRVPGAVWSLGKTLVGNAMLARG